MHRSRGQRRRASRIAAALLVAAVPLLVGGVASAATCADAEHAGGDWPTYGHDLRNTFHQPLEDTIGPLNAALLQPKWRFSVADGGGAGNFQSLPVIEGGCAYVATSQGTVFAINADTGELVWEATLTDDGLTLAGGIFAVAVDETQVYANTVSDGLPTSFALDRATGEVNWSTVVVPEAEGEASAYTNASAILYEGMLVYGISGPEDVDADTRHPGGMALLDT